MASVRLTNSMRDEIERKVLAFKFKERNAEMAKRSAELFDAIIDEHQGADKAKIESLDPQYFTVTDVVRISTPPGAPDLVITGQKHRAVRSSSRLNRWDSINVAVLSAPLRKRVESLRDEFIAKHKEREALSTKLRGLLLAATTVGKLYEMWPELEEIVPRPKVAVLPSRALAPVVDELNKLIPLPTPKPTVKKTKKVAEKM